MQSQYVRFNMRHRGPMESRKAQDAIRQIQQNVQQLKARMDVLKVAVEETKGNVESGDMKSSADGSLYGVAGKLERQISSLERRDIND